MEPLYKQVYQSIKKSIISGRYAAGERVPSEKELSDSFQVSRITSKKAIELLVTEGLVFRQRGKGTFVSDLEENLVEKPEAANNSKGIYLVGLVITDFDDSYVSKVISSIEEAAGERCFVILKRTLGSVEKEAEAIKQLIEYGVDGLILYPAQAEHYGTEILKMIIAEYPLVLIDRTFKGVGAAFVSTDNIKAAKQGMKYLFQLGHEHIGVLGPSIIETTTIVDRFSGILQAYEEQNKIVNRQLWCSDLKKSLPIAFSKDVTPDQDIEMIKSHIKKHPEMTALFALEHNIAVLAKRAAEQLGLRVPEDMSILCFDAYDNNLSGWEFTHLRQNEKKMGKLAMNRLVEMMNGNRTIKKEFLDAQLIEGNSTCSIKRMPLKQTGKPL
ncbi:GntR family transcriptional regulator [Fictibacillus fluitans]|uniref:GntR family transcriptional regulator n=1 Tax=Fictibacillus fluitans TaxID=3058422 RepID=A0ABT8HQ30_9BACL|nr:GntR family transcriptional regulator [Fictibacillus sp. NE201]MDN4522873.1 GntR family transcriptional regulator [Fictibacillus sp. NE201]